MLHVTLRDMGGGRKGVTCHARLFVLPEKRCYMLLRGMDGVGTNVTCYARLFVLTE